MIFDSHVNKTYFQKKDFAMIQLILSSGGHVDHPSEGSPRPQVMLIFFVIFNSTLICHLLGQEAFFVGSLTQDASLTECKESSV